MVLLVKFGTIRLDSEGTNFRRSLIFYLLPVRRGDLYLIDRTRNKSSECQNIRLKTPRSSGLNERKMGERKCMVGEGTKEETDFSRGSEEVKSTD